MVRRRGNPFANTLKRLPHKALMRRDEPLRRSDDDEVMAMMLDFCRRGGKRKSHIGGVTSDLKSNLRRYSYVVGDKLGITGELTGTTGHGLRAGFRRGAGDHEDEDGHVVGSFGQ